MDSYKESIFEPLEYYTDYAKTAHNTHIEEYFEKLVCQSKINVEENRKTAKEYRDKKAEIALLEKKLKKAKLLRTLTLVLAIIISLVSLIASLAADIHISLKITVPAVTAAAFFGLSVFVFKKTKTKIKKLTEKIEAEKKIASEIYSLASAQMAPLNSLFSDYDTFNLIEKTMPQIKFNRQFFSQNLDDLKNNYNFNGVTGKNSSVIDVVSGKLYKNPFLLERFVTEKTVPHTYTGTLLISWTTYSRDSKGNRVARRHTQTLVAHVTEPKPTYNLTTLLNYGSQAAADLTFSRENKHYEDLSEKAVERKVRRGKRKLKKKADKALSEGKSFTEMSNAIFDVLFDASNRNNEQQYRLLFTPLAQKEMIDLIRSEEGYGDDFDFFKNGKLNTIRSEHAQNAPMSTPAGTYRSYDVDDARAKFSSFNNEYFKSIYFDFAPLIAIPAYQEPPSTSSEEITQKNFGYSEYNYETIANKMGARNFAHERTATDSILKTELIKRSGDFDTVAVTAYSYSAEPRTSFIPTLGGDGRMHAVPVHWIEYIPLQKTSLISVKNVEISETEYNCKKESAGIRLPDGTACFRGMFAHLGTQNKEITKFINSVINKGD